MLLLVAGGWAAFRALEDGRQAAAPGLEPGLALFHARVALVEWVLAGLALLTAAVALLSLRRPARRKLLHLGEPGAGEAGQARPGAGSDGAPPESRG
jgi:uncharacterized membrane protein